MRPLIVFILLLSVALGVQAQSLYLYNVNASAFPTIRSDYVAVDAIGRQYTAVTAADFRVSEQAGSGVAVDVTASVTHGCRVVTRDSAASILLIVDESTSMNDPVGAVTRMDLVKNALRNFVGQLNFATGTQVCIIGFSGSSRISCPWSNQPSVLVDSINRLTPRGVTNYETPFYGIPNIFDEFRKRPSSIPKTTIFLTDDQPNPPITNPPSFVDSVSKMAFEQSIVIHSISVSETFTNTSIAQICTRTGGTSHVGTESLLDSFFGLISFSVNTRNICYLEWKAPFGCEPFDVNRNAIATLLRGNTATDTAAYTASLASIAVVTSSAPLLELGSPAANSSLDASVTFTATNTDVLVRGYTISPPTHFTVIDWDYPKGVVTAPSPTNILTLRRNVPRVMRIRLTQGSVTALHTASLSLIGEPCTITQQLRGGGIQVVVVTPNGGDVLTTCDTADIRWSGVPSTAPVLIQWSLDGTTWNTIAAAAKGLSYRWLPFVRGLTYRIRITYVPVAEYTWIQQIGNTGIDSASSIAVRTTGDKLYVTGWFSGPTQFGGSPVSFPLGAKDGFCQEFDGDGLWGRTLLVTGENGKNEKIVGAILDDRGNLYIAGTFESTTATLVGGAINYSLRMPPGQSGSVRDVSNMFLAKISAAGVVDWVRFGQGTDRYSTEATATTIGILRNARGQTQIVVGGTFVSFIHVGYTKNNTQKQMGPALSPGPFYATYDEFGNVIDLFAQLPPTTYRYASKNANDSSGCEFETDHFTGTITKGALSATARSASTDVFVTRRCLGAPAVDESNATFIVRTPFLTMANTIMTVKPTVVGTATLATFTQRVCNTDLYPVQIASTTITGANATDFSLSAPIAGTIIQPNTCLDINIQFRPSAYGIRTAILNIAGDCGTLLAPTLEGEGVSGCSLFVIGAVQMSDVVVGSTSTTNPCLIRNTTNADVTVSVRIQPAGTLFDVNPKGPVVLAPNECFAPTITFDATTATPGIYSAALAYTLPAECGAVTSDLRASVRDTTIAPPKDTAISMGDVDWFDRRLRTINDSVMYLTNTGKQDLTVESIALGAVNGDITADFSLLPAAPFLLKSAQSISIPIRFTPSVRALHTMEVLATIRGLSTPVKGLARGTGILPAIAATGDQWPITPVLSVAVKTGNVTIRNTDATTPLRIENVVFVRTTQSDFRWLVPSTIVFPAIIPPNGTLNIPVQFVPQANGIRSEFVRIYHDAKEGPDPLPPYADTTVELVGSGQVTDARDPLDFAPTLTCDTAIASFWIKNPSAIDPFVVAGVVESDVNNGFELLTPVPFSIAPADSVQVVVRFTPRAAQSYLATYFITNVAVPGLYINVSGDGMTTELVAAMPLLPNATAGQTVRIPITVSPAAPYFSGLSRLNIELVYPSLSMNFISVSIGSSMVNLASADTSVAGRVVFMLDVVGPFEQDLLLDARFATLLAVDTVVNVAANLSTEYTCVNTTSADETFILKSSCAGLRRVVSIGGSSFALTQLYPSPATDKLTVRYSTGYLSPATFDIIDGIGNVVSSYTTGMQASADYELDIPAHSLASGMYVLRLTSGHFVASRLFSVVR